MSTSFAIGQQVEIRSGAFATYVVKVVSIAPLMGEIMMFGKTAVLPLTPEMMQDAPTPKASPKVARSKREIKNLYAGLRRAGFTRDDAIELLADDLDLYVATGHDTNGVVDEWTIPTWVYQLLK